MATTYAGGGAAAAGSGTSTLPGGSGGGGDEGDAGTANTGGEEEVQEHTGGSGIVIVRYPNTYTITVGAGLTSSTTTDGSDKVTSFTAGTDTISFS